MQDVFSSLSAAPHTAPAHTGFDQRLAGDFDRSAPDGKAAFSELRTAHHFERGSLQPIKEVYTGVGALALQPISDLSGEESQRVVMFSQVFQYTLNIPDASEENTCISAKTFL